MIKNIIFDLGGVILKNNPISTLEELNIDNKTYIQLKKFFDDWRKLDLGEKTLEDKYQECHFPKEYDKIYKDRLIKYFKYRNIDNRIIECIDKLKENGYKIFVLSDNCQECSNYYKNNSIFKNIDCWTISCDYHTIKEDGKLFDIFLEKYNLKASECYFIDDKISNTERAKMHGIKSYTFNTEENIDKLYFDMRNNGIKI